MNSNTPDFLKNFNSENGVYFLENKVYGFEQTYIEIRKKEGYLFDDEAVKILPKVSDNTSNYLHWKIRENTANRFIKYLRRKTKPIKILEIGCGNGWFCNMLSKSDLVSEIYGNDINQTELLQASRIFNSKKLLWLFGDISNIKLKEPYFDMIIFNASIQYFEELDSLINLIFPLLKPNGEIHIMDSPFYKSKTDSTLAKFRSEKYFSAHQVDDMIHHYHHHKFDSISQFSPQSMYIPNNLLNKILSLLGYYQSPFYWLMINN